MDYTVECRYCGHTTRGIQGKKNALKARTAHLRVCRADVFLSTQTNVVILDAAGELSLIGTRRKPFSQPDNIS